MSQEQLARFLGASWPTVSRWERGVAVPNETYQARLRNLITLSERIRSAIKPEDFVPFLLTPHPLLRGHPPSDLLQSAYSFQDLLALVDRAKSGDIS